MLLNLEYVDPLPPLVTLQTTTASETVATNIAEAPATDTTTEAPEAGTVCNYIVSIPTR